MIENKELYNLALALKGEDTQVTIAIEEMCECAHALCKYRRLNEGLCEREKVIDNLIFEMVDVQIMIEQILITLDKENLFEEYKKKKIDRLRKRLNDMEEK